MYEEGGIYHIYNQTNNFEPMFRSNENYLFFLKKIRTHLLPIADVLCYCLMPDHFHLLVRLRPEATARSGTIGMKSRWDESPDPAFMQELSHQLKVMLSSYTKAYNRRYNRRGSLFRAKTKAKLAHLAADDDFPFPLVLDTESPYPFASYLTNCFHYIHNNPVAADLCVDPEEWPYSSASDYLGYRNGTICNYALTEQLLGIKRLPPP